MRFKRQLLVAAVGLVLADWAQAQSCAVGTSGPDGMEPCTACALGTYQDQAGQSSCKLASPGFFVATIGSAAQTACPKGKYQPNAGSISCIDASAGSFVGLTGQTAQQQCAPGFYQPLTGQASCNPADLGRFVAGSGATAQQDCPIGGYQDATGQTTCKLASPGFFVATSGSAAQTACPKGKYQPNAGSASCIDASAGSFVGLTGQIAQQPCAPGFYQPLTGQASCNPADLGRFVAGSGATAQQDCPIGRYQDATGQTTCKLASPGFFVNTTAASEQQACELGKYQPLGGQSACLTADPGSFVGQTGSADQELCTPGTFQPNSGQSSCILAPPGRFVAVSGAIAATNCTVGSYQPNSGATSCLLASPGFFVSTVGASAQIAAPVGFFVATSGASAATRCPEGSVSFGGSIACRSAPATGPNIVSPIFDSEVGRVGTVRVQQVIEALGSSSQLFNVSNITMDIGMADPLTRLTLNGVVGVNGVDGQITVSGFGPGITLDEGENLDLDLGLTPSRLGQVTLQLAIDTDEGADLGAAGQQFLIDFQAGADGADVAVSLLADRPAVVANEPFTLWLDAANPGNAAATGNLLDLALPTGLSCSWQADLIDGAMGSGSNLTGTQSDTLFLPPRSRVLYRGNCIADLTAVDPLVVSANVVPDPGISDLIAANNSDTGSIAVVSSASGPVDLNLTLTLLSMTDFLQPNSFQQAVYELRNEGPESLVGGNVAFLMFGAAEYLELNDTTPSGKRKPVGDATVLGVDVGTIRRIGPLSRAIDTSFDLASGESLQLTLSLRTKTLEAQPLLVVAAATLAPGPGAINAGIDEVQFTAKGGLFNDSFEN